VSPAIPVAKFTPDGIDTGGKFGTGSAGVVDTSVTFGAMLLIPVVHLDLYRRKLSKKFEMTLMLFSKAWGKMIH
jgi:hypothetical protein